MMVPIALGWGSGASKEASALLAGLVVAALALLAHRVWKAAWGRLAGSSPRAHTPPADLPEKTRSMKEREPGGEVPVMARRAAMS